MMELPAMTQKKLAEILGVTQSYVANKLRLLNFSDEAQRKICEYGLSARHARSILRLKTDEQRLEAIEKAHAMRMNVSRCEIMVDSMMNESLSRAATGESISERIGHFEKTLEGSLSLLREVGLFARAKREKVGKRIYFTICIE